MAISLRYWCQRIIGVVSFFSLVGTSAFSGNKAIAQITPDATLGAESTQVNPLNQLVDRIDGGAIRGTSLFHSFQNFNIGEGRGAYFSNPTGIENIIGRVIGGNPSQIFGTLGVLGNGNLFFLNPNGIIFGQNAQLDIKGSFVGSTASSLTLPDGNKFSAINPQAVPLLTINAPAPIGLEFEGQKSGTTISNGGNLTVGQDLTLFAGNLDLQGQLHAGRNLTLQAQDTVKIRDIAVAPFIATARGQLLVQGNQRVDIFALNNSASGLFSSGDMVLRSGNTIGGDARYTTGGNFRVEKLNGNAGNLSSPYDPVILASGNVSLADYQGASLHILAGGSVTLGNVEIIQADTQANTINPNNFANLATVNLSDKNGTRVNINGSNQPTLDIRAGIDWEKLGGLPSPNPNVVDSNSWLTTPINSAPTFPAPPLTADITVNGSININQPDGLVLLTNQFHPNPKLPGGTIKVGAINTWSSILGNSGSVFVDSRGDINVTANVNTSAYSIPDGTSGNAGNINLISKGKFSADNSIIFSETYGSGKGGDINIEAKSVSLSNGGQIAAITSSSGQGGKLTVSALDSVEIIGRTNSADSALSTSPSGTGSGGDLIINTGRLLVKDGGLVTTVTTGTGNSGNLTVDASESVELIGAPAENHESGLFSGSVGDGNNNTKDGDGGNLTVTTGQLIIQGGAQLASDNLPADKRPVGSGKPGNVTIIAKQSVEVSGISAESFPKYGSNKPSSIVAFTENDQDAGNIMIETKRLSVKDGGSISNGTDANGNGGNLIIKAPELVEITGRSRTNENGSRVRSITTNSGNGGDVSINTNKLSITDGGRLDTRTKPINLIPSGKAGNIEVTANIFEASGGGQIIATTSGDVIKDVEVGSGDAGKITLTVDQINLSGVDENFDNRNAPFGNDLFTNEGAASGIVTKAKKYSTGRGGDIDITARSISLTDGAQLSANTSGNRDSGNIQIRKNVDASISGVNAVTGLSSGLFTNTNTRGKGGDVTLNTSNFRIADGAVLNAKTTSDGSGGNITVNTNTLEAGGGGQLISSTSGSGNAGKITINAGNGKVNIFGSDASFSDRVSRFGKDVVTNEGSSTGLFTTTNAGGKGGDITVDTSTFRIADNAVFNARTNAAVNGGDGGTVTVNANNFDALSNGQVTTTTTGSGRAGSITVNTTNSLNLANDGSGLFANTATSSTGAGGSIFINSRNLNVRDRAQVSVSSQGSGTAGDIIATTQSILLDKQGAVVTEAASNQGGNINLQVQDLFFLRNNSRVSATAGLAGGGGDGGNIKINIDKPFSNTQEAFIIAFPSENSDIRANAFAGNGGNVKITALGIFGLQFRPDDTRFSDITASSKFGLNGEVILNTLGIDPSRGLSNLPAEPRSPEITQGCQVGGGQDAVKYFETGRGGSPPRPDELFGAGVFIPEWQTLTETTVNLQSISTLQAANATRSLTPSCYAR
jgi:filamentous hemagglutinin family protein